MSKRARAWHCPCHDPKPPGVAPWHPLAAIALDKQTENKRKKPPNRTKMEKKIIKDFHR